jgi:hypothetical protein
MANLTVARDEIGVWEQALVAATVDTVTFTDDLNNVEIINEGTVGIYATIDGSVPTVGAKAAYYVPPGMSRVVTDNYGMGGTVVKLISSGTPKYGVSRGF